MSSYINYDASLLSSLNISPWNMLQVRVAAGDPIAVSNDSLTKLFHMAGNNLDTALSILEHATAQAGDLGAHFVDGMLHHSGVPE